MVLLEELAHEFPREARKIPELWSRDDRMQELRREAGSMVGKIPSFYMYLRGQSARFA